MDSAALERERAHSRAMKAQKMGERTWDAGKEPVIKGRGTAFAREPGSIGRAPESRPGGGGSAASSSGGRGWRDGDALHFLHRPISWDSLFSSGSSCGDKRLS